MKKIVCLFIILVMLVSSTACGEKNDNTVYKIGVLVDNINDDFTEMYAGLISDLFTENEKGGIKYDVTILSSDSSHARQLAQIEVFANQQFDVLVIESVSLDKALELVECAVALYEIDEVIDENNDRNNEEQPENNSNSSLEGTDDGAQSVEGAKISAESNPRVDEVYVPDTVEVQIPIIFIDDMPVLEVPPVEPSEEEKLSEDSNGDAPIEEKPIDTSLCCTMTFDKGTLTSNVIKMIKDLPLKGDINGNGTVEYAFVCSDAINKDYTALIEEIAKYFSENNIAAAETFRYFAEVKDETFYKNVDDNIRKNDGKTDIIFCLTDKALDAVYQLTLTPETPVAEESEEEEKEPPKIYAFGKDFNVIALGIEESTKNFVQSDIIPGYITCDYIIMAQNIVDAAINYINRDKDADDFKQESYVYEYIIVEKEEEK